MFITHAFSRTHSLPLIQPKWLKTRLYVVQRSRSILWLQNTKRSISVFSKALRLKMTIQLIICFFTRISFSLRSMASQCTLPSQLMVKFTREIWLVMMFSEQFVRASQASSSPLSVRQNTLISYRRTYWRITQRLCLLSQEVVKRSGFGRWLESACLMDACFCCINATNRTSSVSRCRPTSRSM